MTTRLLRNLVALADAKTFGVIVENVHVLVNKYGHPVPSALTSGRSNSDIILAAQPTKLTCLIEASLRTRSLIHSMDHAVNQVVVGVVMAFCTDTKTTRKTRLDHRS